MPVYYNLYLFATCVILMHLLLFFVITQNTYLNKTRLEVIKISQRYNVTLIVGCINLICQCVCVPPRDNIHLPRLAWPIKISDSICSASALAQKFLQLESRDPAVAGSSLPW